MSHGVPISLRISFTAVQFGFWISQAPGRHLVAATKRGRNFNEPTLGPSFKQPLTLPVFAKRVPAQGMAVHKMQRRPSSHMSVLYHLAGTPHHVRTLEVQGVHQLHQLNNKKRFLQRRSELNVVYCDTSLLST